MYAVAERHTGNGNLFLKSEASMKETTRLRIGYWVIITILLVWVAVQHEQVERYKYAERFLMSDIWHLQKRVLGL